MRDRKLRRESQRFGGEDELTGVLEILLIDLFRFERRMNNDTDMTDMTGMTGMTGMQRWDQPRIGERCLKSIF